MNFAEQIGYQIGSIGLIIFIAFCVVKFGLKPKYFNKYQKEMSFGAYFSRILLVFAIIEIILFWGK